MGVLLNRKTTQRQKQDSSVFKVQDAIAAMKPNPMTPDGKRMEVKFSDRRASRKG
jgi:hypothetical protein